MDKNTQDDMIKFATYVEYEFRVLGRREKNKILLSIGNYLNENNMLLSMLWDSRGVYKFASDNYLDHTIIKAVTGIDSTKYNK